MRLAVSDLKGGSTLLSHAGTLHLLAILCICSFHSPVHATPFAYIAGGGYNTVSVIDIETNAVVATISMPMGSQPSHVAATPDGARDYVAPATLPEAVSVIDTLTNTILVPAIVVGNGPSGIAVSPDGEFVYVASQFGASVSVIETAGNTVVATTSVGSQPTGIRVTPDGSTVYVAESVVNAVGVIDTCTNEVRDGPIFVGSNPGDLTISRDGSKVYASNFNSRSVSVVDTASDTVRTTIVVGFGPLGMDTSPDDSRLCVVDYDPAVYGGSVAVIDTATNTMSSGVTLPPHQTARRIAVTPDGTLGYVSINLPQRVLGFDTATNVVVGDPIAIDGVPEGIVITPGPM